MRREREKPGRGKQHEREVSKRGELMSDENRKETDRWLPHTPQPHTHTRQPHTHHTPHTQHTVTGPMIQTIFIFKINKDIFKDIIVLFLG